jgi:hypothetical protein
MTDNGERLCHRCLQYFQGFVCPCEDDAENHADDMNDREREGGYGFEE